VIVRKNNKKKDILYIVGCQGDVLFGKRGVPLAILILIGILLTLGLGWLWLPEMF
jgi:hypothetical protein